jgi:predicted PolB exonuclease-like 3'-5' exonuclease
MIKRLLHDEVWAFDAEWVPDPTTGRRTYDITAPLSDDEVIKEMWRQGGATEDEPRPYLKTVLCRIVSVSVVIRRASPGASPKLTLFSLPQPRDRAVPERDLLQRFLGKLGQTKPQLIGFNSQSADLKILVQRALVHRLWLPEFCTRPDKPWEGVDYFVRGSDYSIDLKDMLAGWGNTVPTLHEMTTACGIPGKVETTGRSVVDLWMAGDIERIVQYNECDALSTYLLWLRLAHLAGLFSTDDFIGEEHAVEELLEKNGQQSGNDHLQRYLVRWRAFREASPGATATLKGPETRLVENTPLS